jgi:hypothetical protein
LGQIKVYPRKNIGLAKKYLGLAKKIKSFCQKVEV